MPALRLRGRRLARRAVLEVHSPEVPFILDHRGTKASRRLTVRHHSRHDRRARTQKMLAIGH